MLFSCSEIIPDFVTPQFNNNWYSYFLETWTNCYLILIRYTQFVLAFSKCLEWYSFSNMETLKVLLGLKSAILIFILLLLALCNCIVFFSICLLRKLLCGYRLLIYWFHSLLWILSTLSLVIFPWFSMIRILLLVH